jgi:hypothetical protein
MKRLLPYEMVQVEQASIKADLQQYLQKKHAFISPEFSQVIADVNLFTSAIQRYGLETALAQSASYANVQPDRPVIEVVEAIVDHHLRLVREPERDIVRKSLFEVYTHVAGPQYILEPLSKTRLVSSLCRPGSSRKFVTMLFSLHVFNLICIGFPDELRTRMADVKSFELYMSIVEAICCDTVTAAVKSQTAKVDEKWAKAVARSIEAKLLHFPVKPTKSRHLRSSLDRRNDLREAS